MIRLRSLRARLYRAPIEAAVVTSFGTMRDRPMLLVRAEDTDGCVGWGEAWCNFPAFGAGHRARIIDQLLAPALQADAIAGPEAAFARLTADTAVIALQSGEPGPFAQAIAGVDTALWDLAARRAGQPLWRLLGGADPTVPTYASGINPDRPERMAAASQRAGHTAFKLKVGFGRERDLANLAALRSALGPSARLMADANQGWTQTQAHEAAAHMAPFDLGWLEEPLRADRPWSEWAALAAAAPMPLAAGENLPGADALRAAVDAGALAFIQPDLGKWGGISGTVPAARAIVAAGLAYCPHWLGGGIGLLASAHLLAAIGGRGALEMDVNPNPLRERTCGPLAAVRFGAATLSDVPGLGEPPDEAGLAAFRVSH